MNHFCCQHLTLLQTFPLASKRHQKNLLTCGQWPLLSAMVSQGPITITKTPQASSKGQKSCSQFRVGPLKYLSQIDDIWKIGHFYHNFNKKIVAKLSSQLATDASL
jgi:hypothetical protein